VVPQVLEATRAPALTCEGSVLLVGGLVLLAGERAFLPPAASEGTGDRTPVMRNKWLSDREAASAS
jgi:hypothetical protein